MKTNGNVNAMTNGPQGNVKETPERSKRGSQQSKYVGERPRLVKVNKMMRTIKKTRRKSFSYVTKNKTDESTKRTRTELMSAEKKNGASSYHLIQGRKFQVGFLPSFLNLLKKSLHFFLTKKLEGESQDENSSLFPVKTLLFFVIYISFLSV